MENNSLEILKLFTRKLANCRYKVPAAKLARYLNEGKFGFSFDKTGDNVITNDSVFSNDIELVVQRIRAIFTEPHISLKKDPIVQNVSIASKFDNRSIEATYKDEKLWRVKLGEVAPEFIHTYVHEDNLAIYENRFVCYLLDYLLDAVSKKLSELCGDIQTFNRKIEGKTDVVAYANGVYLDYTENKEAVPVLATLSDPETAVISSLLKSRSILNSLRSYEIYKACKKVGEFDIKTLRPTNILLKDADYNYCYKFYISYLNNRRFITTQSKMYSGFITVNMITALLDMGYTIASDTPDILVNDVAEMKFDAIVFNKGLFTVTLSTQGDCLIILDVKENSDNATARYLFKIVSSSLKSDLEGKTPERYASYLDENRAEGVTRTFVITDIAADSDNVINVVPDEAHSRANIANMIKRITILLEGVSFIHTKYCPVCGSQLIAPDGGDYVCTNCGSLYHVFNYELKDFIWLKRLPKTPENKAKTEDKLEEIPQELIVATEVREPEYRKAVQKSFTGKMGQATKEQQEFYNELKNYLLSFKRVNSRISWSADSFNIGRQKAVKIGFRGLTMVAYLALNPADYADTKYFPHDVSDKKKFEETPMMIKIKSARGVKYAKELIDVICKDLVAKKDFVPETYYFDYMTDEQLIQKGLAKEVLIKL